MLMTCAYSGVRDRFTRGEEEPGGIFDALMDLQLLPQLSGRKKGSRSGGGAETTREKVTVSKPGASSLSMTQRREEGVLLSPSR